VEKSFSDFIIANIDRIWGSTDANARKNDKFVDLLGEVWLGAGSEVYEYQLNSFIVSINIFLG
jgi:hypothetical protein